jgi:transposase
VARLPAQPFPKCLATSGLVAAIIDAKFNRHCPLYRQEEMFQSIGLSVTRATLSHWVIKAAKHLAPLVDVMTQHIREYDIAYADETVVQVLNEPGRKATAKSYMWLFMGGPPDKRSIVYQYHPTRSHVVVKDFLADFKEYLHADCYRAYVNLDSPAIRHVACLAHARRYFMDIVKTTKSKKGLAVDAIKQIARLYRIEQQLTQQQAAPEERYTMRQQQAKPLLDQMEQWLEEHHTRVSPRAPIGKAIAYARKHWQALTRYLDDGRLEIDNNRSERAIKPFVIGRKNWLFHNNVPGAQAGSILFSLVQTCKEHHVDVFAYFKYALDHVMNCQTTQDFENLLPFNCDKTQLDRQRDIPLLQFPDISDK